MTAQEFSTAEWFCHKCCNYVDWEDLDMTWFEAGQVLCVMCAKAYPYPDPRGEYRSE